MDAAKWLHPANGYQGEEFYKRLYGKDAVVTRLGRINIIHLDRPSKDEIKRRLEEVVHGQISGEDFDDDCPLCRQMEKFPYDVVYYGQGD